MLNNNTDGTLMLQEIMEEPESLLGAIEQDNDSLTAAVTAIKNCRELVLTAAGSSKQAALIGRYLFSTIFGKGSEVIIASELGYFSDSMDKHTVILVLSQSGETEEVVDGLDEARKNGATIIAITNAAGSSLDLMADIKLYLNCGTELAFAATKSFIAELAVLYLLAFTADNRLNEGKEGLLKLSALLKSVLAENHSDLFTLAHSLKDKRHIYILARSVNSAIAGETALKLKEVAGIHAEGLPAGELKHGTLALIEDGTPVIVVCPDDSVYDATLNNAAETKARGAKIIGISDKNNELFDSWIRIQPVGDHFYPLICAAPLQLLSCYLAIARGINPDFPDHMLGLIRTDENGIKLGRIAKNGFSEKLFNH
jgi:glucosamine--fructose-6-phosphate aminotransferase (isomerizing)